MEIEKYSPKWLLEKLNTSKTDAHKLIHIIKYRKEIVESTEKELNLSGVVKPLPSKEDAVAEGYRIAKDAGYNYRRVLKAPDHDIYYSGWMDCYDWMTR